MNTPKNYIKSESGLKVTNTYVSPKTEVKGIKIWVDGFEVKPTIQLQLYRNGEAYLAPETLVDGETEYTWTELDELDESGRKYEYTVKEVEVPENYEMSISEDGLTVTNTYVIPKTEITGTKKWIGGYTVKPTIELQLFRDNEPFGEPIEIKNTEEGYTWEDLDATDINGNEYIYTVDEVRVPSNYRKSISEDGFTITNRYIPPTDPTDPEPIVPVGRIKIVKRDSDTNELLKDAEFQIINSNNRIVNTLITNSQGSATSKYLPLGTYTIKEIRAPRGYEIMVEEVTNTISNGVTDEIVIYNRLEKPDEPNPEDPQEPEDPEDPEEPEDPKDPDEEDDFDGDNPGGRPDIPEDPQEPEEPGEETDLDGNNPGGKPGLPVTGSKDNILLYALGILSILGGLILRRKTKENN